MRTISGRIMEEDQRVDPFDCPAGKAKYETIDINEGIDKWIGGI